LPLNKETTLLELHSGVGSLSAFLAPKVKRLVCVEKSPTACDDFSVNLDEFENVELYQAQAMDVLKILDFTPDILLTDPPASGLGRHTLDGILRLAPLVLAYISRDPSTLARDAKKLIEGGYALTGVTPFDIAPQTFQIDSVAIFEL
jgi:23S rRNA (uracil1939-C5)-methyltransferase